MLPKRMYQIARIEFQKCIFFSASGKPHTLTHLPVHARAERGAGAPLCGLYSTPTSRGKVVLDLPLFVICIIHVRPIKEIVYTKYDLRKFVIVSGVCIKIRTCRSEYIFLTYLQSSNDVFHNASYSTGGGGGEANIFQL